MPQLFNVMVVITLLAVPSSLSRAGTNCLSCVSRFDNAAQQAGFEILGGSSVPFINFSLAFLSKGAASNLDSTLLVSKNSWDISSSGSRTKFNQSATFYPAVLSGQSGSGQIVTADRYGSSANAALATESIETDRIHFGTPALAPMAFVRFCLRYPRDCEVQNGKNLGRNALLVASQRKELIKVNRDVNRSIKPQAQNGSVSAEKWVLSPSSGDCKDYAVTKRHDLLKRGWPSHSLLLAEVVISSGEHHLVLVVRTDEGDVVLDNLNQNLIKVSQSEYQWVRAQSTNNPKFWAAISIDGITRTASARR